MLNLWGKGSCVPKTCRKAQRIRLFLGVYRILALCQTLQWVFFAIQKMERTRCALATYYTELCLKTDVSFSGKVS